MKKNYPVFRFWILFLVVFKLFTIGAAHAQYLVPKNMNDYGTHYISHVSFGTINNSSSRTDGGYKHYSSVAATDLHAGETMNGIISITIAGSNQNKNTVAVWVNFSENSDDDFEDAGERFLFTIQHNSYVPGNKVLNVPISIPIPATVPAGPSRIRVGFRSGIETNFTSIDYNWGAGEVEDYNINIISDAPIPGDDQYEANYCIPEYITNDGRAFYISSVKLGSINNSSFGSTGVYTDYSSELATGVVAGETISGTISVTIQQWNQATHTVIVWVNFNENEDDDFNDAGERFIFPVTDTRNISEKKIVQVPISIPIPENTPSGFTGMRIAFINGTKTDITPCHFQWTPGEVEDYRIKILPKEKEEEKDYFETIPASSAALYFDGKDNYVSGASFINGLNEVTMMAWVKSDNGNSKDMVIVGEDLAGQLSLKDGNKPVFTVTTSKGMVSVAGECENCGIIDFDKWHHITGSYSSKTSLISLYIDGMLINTKNIEKKNIPISHNQNANKTFEIGRFSNKLKNDQYFKGNIDEVRVFNLSLTDDQIQQMVYQEIDNNSGTLKGKIVPKDIEDVATGNKVSWNSLLAYYPMTDVKDRNILDYSQHEHHMKLYNLKTIQEQTAPMPYVSVNNGDWTSPSTWLHGDVWDIENVTNNKDWSIVKIGNNVTIEGSFKTSGLIIDAEKTLTVTGDNLVENNWYLELNGTLDLLGDSQLIQTINSDLVTSAHGKILRRQEGTSNPFWYNYWSSPVGITGVTTLSKNNALTNNTNNIGFKLELLKDGNGFNMPFSSGHTANNTISTYWLNTFKNGVTYNDWARFNKSTTIAPGIGYTQKGSGIVGTEKQQYIFEGKPNNGTILIDVRDKGGKGSVPSVSATSFLVGNPYPSTLDIKKFIDDNEGVISGTLQLWQQWSGNSHNLSDYNGGYAQVTKLGSVRAAQFVGRQGDVDNGKHGTVYPSQYISVGQGFIVEIIADGRVEFNNDQRVFVKKSESNKSTNPGSVFFKEASNKLGNKNISEVKESEFKKIRLEFNSVVGPVAKRELVLGFSDITSDDFNYGYDAESSGNNNNDLHLNLNGANMNMQAYSQLTADKVVALNFKSSGNNSFEIRITELENIDDSQDIYLKDNFTGTYFNLKENKPYSFTSEQGKFNERFEIVFQSEEKSLSIEERITTENFIYYKNSERKLFAKKLDGSVTKLAIVNMLGQTTAEFNNVSQDELSNGLTIPTMMSGAYVAYFRTDTNQVLTKKIIIN